jgi:hypothetical protein
VRLHASFPEAFAVRLRELRLSGIDAPWPPTLRRLHVMDDEGYVRLLPVITSLPCLEQLDGLIPATAHDVAGAELPALRAISFEVPAEDGAIQTMAGAPNLERIGFVYGVVPWWLVGQPLWRRARTVIAVNESVELASWWRMLREDPSGPARFRLQTRWSPYLGPSTGWTFSFARRHGRFARLRVEWRGAPIRGWLDELTRACNELVPRAFERARVLLPPGLRKHHAQIARIIGERAGMLSVEEKLGELLRTLFADNSWEDTLKLWRTFVANGGTYADDALACLDAIVARPPPDLAERLRRDGWIALHHDDEVETPYTHDELVAWLRARTAELRAAR